ncbi:hypothetical protein MTO96_009537 [Rhipicephalus appendiculatus]
MGAPRSSPAMTSALQDKDGEDVKGADLEAPGIDETCSATQGDRPCAHKYLMEPQEHNDSFAVRVWSRALFLLSEHMVDAVVPPDCQALLRDAWTVLQNVERASGVGYFKPCLLVASIFCFVILTTCCKLGSKKNTREVIPPSATQVHAMGVDWKSNFSITEMARFNNRGDKEETGYICPNGKTLQAAVIQHWARYEFKRWLRSSKAQHGNKEPPLSSQCGIYDKDLDVVVKPTLEEDTLVTTDEHRHPGDQQCSDDALPLWKQSSKIKYDGCDDA